MNLIDKKDFDCIGQVVNHCDLKKLRQAICEAQDFDLRELFCDSFWFAIYKEWEINKGSFNSDFDDDDFEAGDSNMLNKLIIGGEFQDCNGRTVYFKGLKAILAYYSYSRYLQINQLNDTATGHKTKTNDFSLPTDKDVIKQHADRYRSMGYSEFKRAQAFLCLNSDDFPDYDTCNCAPCGCNGSCGKKTKAKGYGIKGNIIKKYGL